MLNADERERLDFLEAKAYFEGGLTQQDERELDNLIAKCNQYEVEG